MGNFIKNSENILKKPFLKPKKFFFFFPFKYKMSITLKLFLNYIILFIKIKSTNFYYIL